MYRLLSIDGGGIRGLIPALVLAEVERMAGAPCSSLFDLIAGTSTGGILALGLAHGYPAAQLAQLYEDEGSVIFSRPIERKFSSVFGLAEEKYPATGIESVLEKYFGDARLKDARTDVLITSYEIERRIPFFFRSARARQDPAYDFAMKDVARATSAAPTYFEPKKVPAPTAPDYYALIDGGVFANNPAMCAFVDALTLAPRDARCVLSLGTGSLMRQIRYDDARGWGIAKWAKPLLEIVFDGVSSTVDHQLRQLMPSRYLRLQATLEPGLEAMDDASRRNLRALRVTAEKLILERRPDLENLLRLLVDPPDSLPAAA